MAYRIVASKPLKFWWEIRKKLKDHNEDMGVVKNDDSAVYDSMDTMTAFNMVTHDNCANR